VLRESGNAGRHRGVACTEVDMRGRKRVDEFIEIEQVLHLVLREEDHERRLRKPSACWFQGTRCVTPAPPTRPRFARYQS
jgi:hypothetical protein